MTTTQEKPDSTNEHLISEGDAPHIIITRRVGRGRRIMRAIAYTFGVAVCLISMAAGTVFGHFYWGSDTFRKMINNDPRILWDTVTTGDPMAHYTVASYFPDRTSLNILVLGVDYDYDSRGHLLKTGGRSDAILIVRLDFINKTIDALSIPRDTAVRIPGRSHIDKINAAHAYGGPELSMETIQSVFGIAPDAYVTMNFDGFQKIVDTLGGIDVTVQKQLDYDDNWGHLHIHLKPGYQHMNGYQAMGFVRMRHSDSDLMRAQRQHDFIEALRTRVKSAAAFNSLPKAIDAVNNAIGRNLTNEQLFTIVAFARSLPKESIHLETLPSIEGPSYVSVDADKAAEVIKRMFFPNRQIAVNIDAPSYDAVRSLNASYGRGRHRRGGRHGASSGTSGEGTDTGAVTDEPTTDLSTDENAAPPPSDDTTPPPDASPPTPTDTGGGTDGKKSGSGSSAG